MYSAREDSLQTLDAADRSRDVHLPFQIQSPDRDVRYVWLADLFDLLGTLRILVFVRLFAIISGFSQNH
jgi:hypothetical protein